MSGATICRSYFSLWGSGGQAKPLCLQHQAFLAGLHSAIQCSVSSPQSKASPWAFLRGAICVKSASKWPAFSPCGGKCGSISSSDGEATIGIWKASWHAFFFAAGQAPLPPEGTSLQFRRRSGDRVVGHPRPFSRQHQLICSTFQADFLSSLHSKRSAL